MRSIILLCVFLSSCGNVQSSQIDASIDGATADAQSIDALGDFIDSSLVEFDASSIDANATCVVDSWNEGCESIVSPGGCEEQVISGCPLCELHQINGFSTYVGGNCCLNPCCMSQGWVCP